MKTAELLKQIEQRFSEKLEEKTGWGRNEIKAAYHTAVIEVLAEISDQITTDK